MTLKQLVYVSAARRDLAEHEYARILTTARLRNAENGVTGMLLSIEQGFLQVLEGSSAAVDDTFARISQDTRHTSVRKLFEAPTARRSFGGWFMGFHDLRNQSLLTDGAFPITKAALTEHLPEGLGAEVLILIRTFYSVNKAAI